MVYWINGRCWLTWILWQCTWCFSLWSGQQFQNLLHSIKISAFQQPLFPPAEHRKRPSWPRATVAARDRSGRGWPDCATSTLKPTNKPRMFPGCDLCSSLSNSPLWCVRGAGPSVWRPETFLPFLILTSRWRAQTRSSHHNLSSVHNLWDPTPLILPSPPLSLSPSLLLSFLPRHWLWVNSTLCDGSD